MADITMPESTGNEQTSTRFKPGQSGNPAGRPKGSRQKLSEDFLKDLVADWKEGGLVALQKLRQEKPEVYVKVIADLLPKEVEVKGSIDHEHTHRPLSATAAWLAEATGLGEGGALQESVPH